MKILFVCHGNICRSPMAEAVMGKVVRDAGLEGRIDVDSAAMRTDEIGSGVYPPAMRELAAHGLGGFAHRARLMTMADYRESDLVVGMDEENARDVRRLTGGDPEGKFRLLMSFAGEDRAVADPWYTRDFSATWRDVSAGCAALLEEISERKMV